MEKYNALLLSYFLYSSISAAIFTASPLTTKEITEIKAADQWHADCPVPLNRLESLTFSHYDFQGQIQTGHLIVFDAAAAFYLKALKKMLAIHYPLENYQGTQSFNCRSIRGESEYSLHAYGLAIDINITRNPYLGEFGFDTNHQITGTLVPANSSSFSYLNRALVRPGMNEAIVHIMAQSGFIVWGGDWQDRVDYQHFQIPNRMAFLMANIDKAAGEQLMQLIIDYPDSAKKMSSDSKWLYLHDLYPERFMSVLKKYFSLLSTLPEYTVFNDVYRDLSNPAIASS